MGRDTKVGRGGVAVGREQQLQQFAKSQIFRISTFCAYQHFVLHQQNRNTMVRLRQRRNIFPGVNTCQLKFQQSTTDIFIVIVPYCIL